MKEKLPFIILSYILLLVGVGIFLYLKKPVAPILCHVEVPVFPMMSNPDSTEEDESYQVLSESAGWIADYTIHDDVIYYIVGYSFDVDIKGYQYISVFKQSLTGGELEKVIDYESDKYMEITEFYYDEHLRWVGCVDDYVLWQYTLYDEHIEETPYEDEEPLVVKDVIKGYNVDADTLEGTTWICHENKTYIVWAKWPYHGEGDTSIGSTTNILNKETGEVTVIENSDYCEGALKGQVLYGDYLFFYVYDDEKMHINEGDFFGNNYMFNLKTGRGKRLTANYGTLGETDSILYDKPKIYEKGICFLSKIEAITEKGPILSNQYMYYMELE